MAPRTTTGQPTTTPDAAAPADGNGHGDGAGRRGLPPADVVERLRALAAAVQAAVTARRAVDPSPDDPFRGLYLGDEEIDRLLAGDVPPVTPMSAPPVAPDGVGAAGAEAVGHGWRHAPGPGPADAAHGAEQVDSVGSSVTGAESRTGAGAGGEAASGAQLGVTAGHAGHAARLAATAQWFGLDPVDVDLLIVAAAPDVDSRFERFYGYLHDDVTRRRASIGLALELCGLHPASAAARRRLSSAGALVTAGLVAVEDTDRPFLTRALRVPDRVTAHLLGGDDPDQAIAHLLAPTVPVELGEGDAVDRIVASLNQNGSGATTGVQRSELVYVGEAPGASGRSYATSLLERAGQTALVVDLERLADDDVPALARTLGREARLRGAALIAGPVEALVDSGAAAERNERTAPGRGPDAVRSLAELPGPVVLTGRSTWDPHWSRRVPLVLTAPAPTVAERARNWLAHLDGHVEAGVDAALTTSQFRLTPEQVADAATAAVNQAALAGRAVDDDAIRAGARSRNGAGLEKRARRIEPGVGWDDLVLPPHCLAGLRELAARVRHREQVLSVWDMRPGGGRGQGITALFAGDSGTGKTMSAEVVAGALGLDLYVVDLATVVDKYVGETEKNLERIFSEADGVNGVLLFDEADALFGKRSEVRDAHDRYANIEVAYLLQRMETFDGLAILTTNLRANLDEAFTRRLDSIVDFPLPDEEHRRLLWERCLGSNLPRTDDVDLDFCADRFELAGGNIRSIALTAAYLAAARDEALSMADLMRATQREYRKLGRLTVASEFGPWVGLD